MKQFLIILFLCSTINAFADLNVTNFGAVGDCVTNGTYATTSGSASIVGTGVTFTSSDVGKMFEIHDAGTATASTNQTLIATIATFVDSTRVTLSTTAGVTAAGQFGYYGTNNFIAFSNCLAAAKAVGITNVLIPAGVYLLIDPAFLAGTAAPTGWYADIALNRGGLNFMGTGAKGSTTLWFNGGWKVVGGLCQRGFGFVCNQITNDFPITLSNIVLNGGVLNGFNNDQEAPASPVTGRGIDISHSAFVTLNAPCPTTVNLTNCDFVHWRGEQTKDTSSSANIYLHLWNCNFYDGNLTALNNFAHLATNCTFTTFRDAEEYYRQYSTNISVMDSCLFSDCTFGSALNGGTLTNAQYIFYRNVFTNLHESDGCWITISPSCNVTIASNNFYGILNTLFDSGSGGGIYTDTAGAQGSGTVNSNIVIAYNNATLLGTFFSEQGLGGSYTDTAYIFSNRLVDCISIGDTIGYQTNVFCSYNTSTGLRAGGFITEGSSGQYFIDSSNIYAPALYSSSSSNLISYAAGGQAQLRDPTLSAVNTLDYSSPERIPTNAVMTITNLFSGVTLTIATKHATYLLPNNATTNLVWSSALGDWTNGVYVLPIANSISYYLPFYNHP